MVANTARKNCSESLHSLMIVSVKRKGELNMAKVVTNEVRFSYTHLWEPQAINGSEPKYSVSLIIPKKDTETIRAIKEAIEIAKKMELRNLEVRFRQT